MRYVQAVKLWNAEEHTVSTPDEVYATPRKGTEAYNEVRMLMKKPVAESVKIADLSKKIETPVPTPAVAPILPATRKIKLKKASMPPVEIKEKITEEIKEEAKPKSIKIKLKKAVAPEPAPEPVPAPAPVTRKIQLKKAPAPVAKELNYKFDPSKLTPGTMRNLYTRFLDRREISRFLLDVFKARGRDSADYTTKMGIYAFLYKMLELASWENSVKELVIPLPGFYGPAEIKIVKEFLEDVFPSNDLYTTSVQPLNVSKWNSTRKSGGISDIPVARYGAEKMISFEPTVKGKEIQKVEDGTNGEFFWNRIGDGLGKYAVKSFGKSYSEIMK